MTPTRERTNRAAYEYGLAHARKILEAKQPETLEGTRARPVETIPGENLIPNEPDFYAEDDDGWLDMRPDPEPDPEPDEEELPGDYWETSSAAEYNRRKDL